MYRLVIAAHGDNEQLHREALEAACKAIELVNGAPVYRAYLEKMTLDGIEGVANPQAREW
jgi:hypothetical protein